MKRPRRPEGKTAGTEIGLGDEAGDQDVVPDVNGGVGAQISRVKAPLSRGMSWGPGRQAMRRRIG
ncbi:hypothetical protein DKM19_39910 [Streptosporangium sp. 'caverna']|nr:hypothetical protein DKM19_39910 [Streptosporangium sp. 'caverna']